MTINSKRINEFLKTNSFFDLWTFQFHEEAQSKKLKWPVEKAEKESLLQQLKTLQRLFRLTNDQAIATKLYNLGFHSAVQIASLPQQEFVEKAASLFKSNDLSPEAETEALVQAKQVYERALARRSQAVMTYASIAQHTDAHYRSGRFNNVADLTDATFGGMPSYEDLFGGLDFCTCEECRSIFSPAAYFVDLMRLQARYIHGDDTTTPPAQLYTPLKTRRPDLWELPLSCENTNTRVSKLSIVNKVLSKALDLPDAKTGYKPLADEVYPFNLPFHLPLSELRSYLGQQQSNLPNLWKTLSNKPDTTLTTNIARETINLSPEQWALYSKAEGKDSKKLATYYGLKEGVDLVKALTNVDVFLKQTGLSHTQLHELLFQNLTKDEIKANINGSFFINVGGSELPIHIKDNGLKLLTLERLDHIHRFIRLAQSLEWSFTDLNWALYAIGQNREDKKTSLIDDFALPYLAWIKNLHQELDLPIVQICAYLFKLKDYGLEDGPTFFQQVFQNSHVPGWSPDKPWNINPWNVPEIGSDGEVSPEDQAIQTALSAALQISQDDLTKIADEILCALGVDDRKLPLTLENLSILYRLSQLPILTGLSIEDCFILLNLPGVSENPREALLHLAGPSGEKAQAILVQLKEMSQWLLKSNLSIGQLQYLLTGDSQDKTIQNRILGIDEIKNFIQGLQEALHQVLLTKQLFSDATSTLLQAMRQTENLDGIWSLLLGKDKPDEKMINYKAQLIDETGIVLKVPSQEMVENTLSSYLKFHDMTKDNESLKEDFISLVVKTLTHFYHLQQQTFNQHLGGLYSISPNLVPVLKIWGGLTQGDFSAPKDLKLNVNRLENHIAAVPLLQTIISNTEPLLEESDDRIIRLQLMQRYAALMQDLSLSPAEAQSILENPQYYGINYQQADDDKTLSPFTLKNIQTLLQFKQFIVSFQDTQNRLLGYFDAVKSDPVDPTLHKTLGRLTQWNPDQIQLLMTTLWNSKSKDKTGYGKVEGLALMQAYFKQAETLNLDINGLIQVNQLGCANPTFTDYQEVAHGVWGALQKEQETIDLQSLINEVDEKKRCALVGLALNKLELQTPRQLYEYLLIDVEVSGVVTTSYVKEAISAVQLYINRCRNHLEPGIVVDSELQQWWEWLEHYRIWEANREVFLYPENYIQPELRKNATPQFKNLVSDLKQADLSNPESADAALRSYMQGFAEVADLEIIGSSSHDQDPLTKQICFVGRTRQQPYSYYTRTVTLKKGGTPVAAELIFPLRYTPVEWKPWEKVNLQIKPVGPLSPVFAFGKWFLFWIEQQVSNSSSDGNDKTYTTTINYSSLDFNQQWVAPQTFESIENAAFISEKLHDLKFFFDRVYPTYFSSSQTIVCPYGKDDASSPFYKSYLFQLGSTSLSNGIRFSVRHALKDPLPHANDTLDYLYVSDHQKFCHVDAFVDKHEYLNGKPQTISLWIKIDKLPKSKTSTPILDHPSPRVQLSINSDGHLIYKTSVCTDSPLKEGIWYHIALYSGSESKPSVAWINGQPQTKKVVGWMPTQYLGYDSVKHDYFSGAIQEFLTYDRYLSGSEIKALYDNGKDSITHDFGHSVDPKDAFTTPVAMIPIIGQPNWYVFEGENMEILAAPYIQNQQTRLECFRLNTTANRSLSQTLFLEGVPGLLSIESQRTPEIFFSNLGPKVIKGSKEKETYVAKPWPSDQIDFMNGSMCQYYWELFFHTPFLVAHELQVQQQFSAAKEWYEYIFNPTVDKSNWDLNSKDKAQNNKYWRFLGLRSYNNPLLARELAKTWAEEVQADLASQAQLQDYHNDPFDPQAIARLRPIAYQKTIVMHYIDNLIAWGDRLFRLYTIEDIVQATRLYITAYDLLGEQPVDLGACPLPDNYPETLENLAKPYDGDISRINEFLVEAEQRRGFTSNITVRDTPHNYIPGDYFGLPENANFIAYWDKIQQRLYNIRHGLNIDGVRVKLPLFQPTLDPAKLVNQIQSGENTRNPLPRLQVRTPYYRFSTLIQKAKEVAQSVTQLGQSLLSTLEKRDSAQLALLYSTNQQHLSALTRSSKQDQLEASTESLEALQNSLHSAQERLQHYTSLIDQGLSAGEIAQLTLSGVALDLQIGAQAIKGVSIAGYLAPNTFGAAFGGMSFGDAINQGASVFEGSSNALSMAAGLAGTMAGYQRRDEDWQLQRNLAQSDVEQIQHQIISTQYMQQIASQGIQLLERSIEQEQKVEKFLQSKFTNQELYQWMTGKLSALYFQAYQLAYDLAIQAQQAWQFERGSSQDFIQTGYWNNLHHGLLAGEALQLDLQRMESTYMQQNQRTFEIEKTVSLAQLKPQALLDLRATGSCNFELSEADFDFDYAGHYRRQIKTVSLSFPAVVGAYQNVHATLTQTTNRTLLKDDPDDVKYLLGREKKAKHPEFIQIDINANQQVALSQELNDNGLFVLNFNDDRYLPFEGTGAISSWKLEMPKVSNPFDFSSLTDVVMRVQYTASQGSSAFKKVVTDNLSPFNGSRILFMAQEFSTAWHGFIHQSQPLDFTVSPNLLRPNLKGYLLTELYLYIQLTDGPLVKLPKTLNLVLNLPEKGNIPLTLEQTDGGYSALTPLEAPLSDPQNWTISIDDNSKGFINMENVRNMFIALSYKGNIFATVN